MSFLANLTTAWVHQPRTDDRRIGFVIMDTAEMAARVADGDAQDPRLGAFALLPIKYPIAPLQTFLGVTLAMNKGIDPIIMLDRPVTHIADGDEVKISGSGWATLDGLWFECVIVNAALGQIQLLGVDTTAETGTGAGATVHGREVVGLDAPAPPPPEPPVEEPEPEA